LTTHPAQDADNKKAALHETKMRIEAWNNVESSSVAKYFDKRKAREELEYLRLVESALTTPAPQSEKMDAFKVVSVHCTCGREIKVTKEPNNEQ